EIERQGTEEPVDHRSRLRRRRIGRTPGRADFLQQAHYCSPLSKSPRRNDSAEQRPDVDFWINLVRQSLRQNSSECSARVAFGYRTSTGGGKKRLLDRRHSPAICD